MSREVRRVPLDFDFPIDETWPGFLTPDQLKEEPCGDCGETGYSPYARHLHDRWYGKVPFDPAETGSTPFTPETPAVHALAERHVANDAWFYGTGELAILREALRLCELFNGAWCHHLRQEDVDALVAAGRLMDFTHTWSRETRWQRIDPAPTITAEQVNVWSISGMGHDSINCGIVIDAVCGRAGEPATCSACNGWGSKESYPGQRAEQEAWKPIDPPTGEGYQLWQTISEGGPCSPVFSTPEGLADWIIADRRGSNGSNTPREDLIQWIRKEGVSLGSFVVDANSGVITSGVEAAATSDPGPNS